MGVNPLAELSILIVDIEHMTELNKRWMGGTGPTDVLSIPMDDAMPGRPDSSEPGTPILGDLVLSPEVAEAQAKDAGHSTADEMHMLTVHGVLHILGYDHAEPEQAKEMFGLQNRLLDAWRAKRDAAAES
jgi:probable rRNA maturation factor